nr:hypothetical protein GCM10020093_047740 [Planobispora longispora]
MGEEVEAATDGDQAGPRLAGEGPQGVDVHGVAVRGDGGGDGGEAVQARRALAVVGDVAADVRGGAMTVSPGAQVAMNA